MRKRNIIVVGLPVLLFILLAIGIELEIITSFESWAYIETVEHMSPFVTNVLKIITHLGDPMVLVTLCIVLLIIPKTRKKYGYPISIALISSLAINLILKSIFARPRPDILRLIDMGGYSFPSGHAMLNSTLYIMVVLLIFKYYKSNKIRIITFCLGVLLFLTIGMSRVYLGVHYIGDVIGGWLLGFSISCIVYMIINYKTLKENSKIKTNN